MTTTQNGYAPQWLCDIKTISKITVSGSNSVSQWPSLKWPYRLIASYKIAIFYDNQSQNDSVRKLNSN